MPKPFRLATLLRLREQLRDERRTRLAEAERAAMILDQRIEEITAEMRDLQQYTQQTLTSGAVNVDRMLDAQRYDAILKVDRQTIEQQRQQIEVEVAKRREALVVADRDVRVLEKLREQQIEREREEAAGREARVFDELALQRHVRKEAR
jgi:flagellar FliJ protein